MDSIIDSLAQNLERMKYAGMLSSELNNYMDLQSTLSTVIRYISQLTGCQAVGIRLHKDGDYPYYVYHGFPACFIEKENSLCSKDQEGEPILSPDGSGYLLECMCGNIIRGRFDPNLDFFSPGGSFWCNHTSLLLTTTDEEILLGRNRNFCNTSGYESVALIPIRAPHGNIGLVQLNDYRTGMFDKGLINFLEMLAGQIGLAVNNSIIYEDLKNLETVDYLTGCYNRKYFMDMLATAIHEAARQKESFNLVILSLDNFKALNYHHGYDKGDQALRHFAKLLKNAAASDTICRIGGDEFSLISRRCGIDLAAFIDSVAACWAASYDQALKLGVSTGVASWDHLRPLDSDQLISAADRMMLAEKDRKKGPHFNK